MIKTGTLFCNHGFAKGNSKDSICGYRVKKEVLIVWGFLLPYTWPPPWPSFCNSEALTAREHSWQVPVLAAAPSHEHLDISFLVNVRAFLSSGSLGKGAVGVGSVSQVWASAFSTKE